MPRPAGARAGGPPPWAALDPAARAEAGLTRVRRALRERGEGGPPPFPVADARAAAVLVPLFDEADELRVVLTRRTDTVGTHRGDVAFPGGRAEPDEDAVAAALREAHEEIGLDPAAVEVLGQLDGLATVVSGYEITPVVAALPGRPTVVPNPAEIARVFDVSASHLLEDGVYHEEVWELPSGSREVHFFELEDETVWGATARILHQLLCVLTGLPADPGRPL